MSICAFLLQTHLMSAEPLYGWWHLVFDSHTSMPPSPASLVYSVLVRNGSVNEVEFLGPILKKWLGPTRLRDCSLLHIVCTFLTKVNFYVKFWLFLSRFSAKCSELHVVSKE